MSAIQFNPSDVILWFNAIRNLPDDKRSRGLDAFWSGQINSKVWLVETLNQHNQLPSNIHIFGGWVGVLSSILFQSSKFYINKLYSIDIDPWCKSVADTINAPNRTLERFKAVTSDMATYDYQDIVDIVINTSTEHVTQVTYDLWYEKIPKGTLVLLQGNDFFDCDEHIRCSKSLDEFITMNHVIEPIFADERFFDIYHRYMCLFRKN
jgi:hypothetical protein